MDVMMNVPGTLWHNLGKTFKDEVTSEAIIKSANLNYEISYHTMYDDIHSSISGYHSYYRNDTSALLGVVNQINPRIVQNVDSFLPLEDLMMSGDVSIETVNEFDKGKSIVGVFKTAVEYNVVGEPAEHYLVVVNDHLKPDGKIMVLHTPVRVACMNAMNDAVAKAVYSMRVPVIFDPAVNKSYGKEIMYSIESAAASLNARASKLLKVKVTEEKVEEMLDELLPFVRSDDGMILNSKANDSISIQRDTFQQCLQVDNLSNFDGTGYALYQATIDYTQHYFKSPEKGYDFNNKLGMLPKIGQGNESGTFVTKCLKFINSIAA